MSMLSMAQAKFDKGFFVVGMDTLYPITASQTRVSLFKKPWVLHSSAFVLRAATTAFDVYCRTKAFRSATMSPTSKAVVTIDCDLGCTHAITFFLVAFQPLTEEIFFRGFLMEKIDSFAGKNVAIFLTAVLFGIAHMSYSKIFPVLLPIAMGIILGLVVYKTKNLLASIVAHTTFNVVIMILAVFAQSL